MRPTILQIIPKLDTGGAEQSTIEIAAALASVGARALVLSEGGRLETPLAAAGGELIRLPVATKNPFKIFANTSAISDLISTHGVALVHARSRAPAWSALGAARRSGIPFVTTYHGAYSERGPLKRRYNSVMAKGDAVIANSGYTANLIRRRYGEPRGEMFAVHRGVDFAEFDPRNVNPDRVEALRSRWRVGESNRIILHAARLTGWKGQREVVEAVVQLRRANLLPPDLRVVLVGDDQGRSKYREKLEHDIREAALANVFRLPGHCDDMPAAFATATLCVVASNEPEAFGRAAVEAQAMGCPVISTNIGAPPETVLAHPSVATDQRTGWLIPPSDPEAIAVAINEALQMPPNEFATLRRRGFEHVRKNFSIANMQLATLAIYDELLESRLAHDFAQASKN